MTETRTPPKLHRPAFHVWMLPEEDPTYHHVTINHADQLRAELESKSQGLGKPQDTPMHLTALWLWAALVRTGRYEQNFATFKTECLAYDPDREADDDDTGPDPTEASTN